MISHYVIENGYDMKKKCYEIEFWRFIFSFIVALHHSRILIGDENCLFFRGSYAVEFFFIVSGYLLMQSISKQKDECLDLGNETLQFMWKKYKTVCPNIFIAWGFGYFATILLSHKNFIESAEILINGVWEITLLHMAGIYPIKINVSVWYISSMLLCMAIMYPFIRKYKNFASRIVLPVLSLLILGYLYQTFGHLRGPTKWIGFTHKANLRAFAELSCGIICYDVVEKIKAIRLKKAAAATLTVLKYLAYMCVIFYMTRETLAYDFAFLIIMMIAIILSFSQLGIDGHIYDNKVVVFLGKFSLNLFLVNYPFSKNLKYIIPQSMPVREQEVLYILVCLIMAYICMVLSDAIKNNYKKLFNKTKKLFLET